MDQTRNRLVGINFENIPFVALTLLLILIPTFFIPSLFLSFQFAKALLVFLGVIATGILFTISLIKKGTFVLPKNPVFLALPVALVVYGLASLFSSSSTGSFIGYGFEIGTFISLLLMVLCTYLVSVSFSNSKKLTVAHSAFFCVAGVLGIFHVLRIFLGSKFLSFGIFSDIISNTIGKWNEVGIFFAMTTLLSLIALEILPLRKKHRFGLYILLVVSVLLVAFVNFVTIWYVLGVCSVLFFIHQSVYFAGKKKVSVESEQSTAVTPARRKISVLPIILIIASVIFILPIGHNFVQNFTHERGVNDLEVRPSWIATYQVFTQTISASPVLGAGPNRFGEQWQLFRPNINSTNFWNTQFSQGIGFIPTAFVETGILGVLAWGAFFLALLFAGVRVLLTRPADSRTRYFLVSSLVATVFLWVMNIFYIPGITIFALTFFFTGLFIASLLYVDSRESWVFPFYRVQKLNFAVVIGAVFVLVGGLNLGYHIFERGRASYFFQKSFSVIDSEKNVDAGKKLMLRSAELSGSDLYYRSIAELDVLTINNIMAQAAGKTQITEAERGEFQRVLGSAVESALLATKKDPANFQNQLIAARVYQSIVPVGIKGSYESAKISYEKAIKLSPRNPALFLGLANLEIANRNFPKAKEYLVKSLELKPNYVDAYFLQSQLDFTNGDITSAIKSIEKVVSIQPSASDPSAHFRLGLLRYENNDWDGAIDAFTHALSLQPVYANAKYFLGLSYVKVGRVDDAISIFENLKKENQDNAELSRILENLRAGRDPFANAQLVDEVSDSKASSVSENN